MPLPARSRKSAGSIRSASRATKTGSGRCSTSETWWFTCSTTRCASSTTSRVCGSTPRVYPSTYRPTAACRSTRCTARNTLAGVKLAVVAVGKLKEAWVQEGCAEYAKRVRGKLPLDLVEVKDDSELVRKIPPRYKLWALDERGKELSSEELAATVKRAMDGGEQGIAMVIGGADGLPRELVARADFVWSLGRLTLPH